MARPRSVAARQAVLAVASDILAEVGVEKLTIEEVAARSRVAKTTIYRHWPCKSLLVADAVASVLHPLVPSDTGDVREDLVSCFEGMGAGTDAARHSAVVLSLFAAASRDAEYSRLARALVERRRAPVRAVLERACQRGQIEPETDIDTIVDLLSAAATYRRLVLRRPVRRGDVERVLDVILPELDAQPLTGVS